MTNHRLTLSNRTPAVRWTRIVVLAGLPLGLALAGNLAWAGPGACTRTANDTLNSCRYEALADYWLALGKCQNLSSKEERLACRAEAQEALAEARAECADQHEARLEVCEELGEAPYAPVIRPRDFVTKVTNPFFPLVPGTTFIYEKKTDEGLERIEVKVTHETKEILGVTCTVVRDTAIFNGELEEDTEDWFAQDKYGNVWYFGERTAEYEDGFPVSVEGAWEAGVDGAQPGIIMLADPEVDDIYRQEFLLGEAEDLAEVEGLNKRVSVPFGSFRGCLQTEDFSSLEPDALEHKFYAPGVGLVLELNPRTGARTELVKVIKE